MNTDLQTAQLVNILSTDGTRIRLWKTGSVPALLAVHEGRTTLSISGSWRGWMGIEPTQDASTAPRRRF
jgi:hypothetical protein